MAPPQKALIDLFILLFAGSSAFLLCKRTKLSSTITYLLVGIVLGPSVFNLIQPPSLHLVAEIGILLLLFSIGLELPLHRLKSMRKYVFGLGGAQMMLCSLALFLFMYYVFNFSVTASFVLSITLSLSSTAFVIQLLSEKAELSTKKGRATFAVVLFQDLMVIFLFVYLSLQAQKGMNTAHAFFMAFFERMLSFCLLIIAGKWLTNSVMNKLIARYDQAEFFNFSVFSSFLGLTLLSAWFGLSTELGAFIAGICFADSPIRHRIEDEIRGFRLISLAIFFMLTGVGVNLASTLNAGGEFVIFLLSMMSIKFILIIPACLLLGLTFPTTLNICALLSGCSEFAFVVLMDKGTAKLISPHMQQVLISCVTFSMILTPGILWIVQKTCQKLWPGAQHTQSKCLPYRHHVIIAGFGSIGQTIARIFDAQLVHYVAFDRNSQRVFPTHPNKRDLPLLGDSCDMDFLRQINVETAHTFVVAFDEIQTSLETVKNLRDAYPKLNILACAQNYKHAQKLNNYVQHVIVPDKVESGIQMGLLALKNLGFSMQSIAHMHENFHNHSALVAQLDRAQDS